MRRILLMSVLLLVGFSTVGSSLAATYGQEVVAAVLLAEARGEGDKGMKAVVEVIRTRADKKGVSMLAVVRPGAFTSLNGTNRDALLQRFKHHPLFADALRIARTAYNEPHRLPNLTRDATHVAHKSEVPWWARGKRPVARIGNHVFYRLARF